MGRISRRRKSFDTCNELFLNNLQFINKTINKKKIDIYADARTLKALKKKYDFCFYGGQGYIPIMKPNLIKKKQMIKKGKKKAVGSNHDLSIKEDIKKSIPDICNEDETYQLYLGDCLEKMNSILSLHF